METVRLLRLLAIYVVLLALDRAAGIGAIKSLGNAFAVAIPLMLAFGYLVGTRPILVPTSIAVGLSLLLIALGGSWAVNGIANFADFTKMLLGPMFVVLGYNALAFDRSDPTQVRALRLPALVLLAVPLAMLAIDPWLPSDDPDVISIFANRNNAGLYMVCLANVLFLLGVRLWVIVSFLVAVALLFSTIGVLLAVVLALVFSLSFKRYVGLYATALAIGVGLYVVLPDLPIFERLTTVIDNAAVVHRLGLWGELDRMSYLDLYLLTGQSSELSFFFRLKHWQELFDAYLAGGAGQLLFGLGVGSSIFHTDIGLVPHNDYLRFLVETGPLGLAGFVLLSLYLVAKIGRDVVVISTAAVAIYFFSENLIANFSAMALYYYFAGYWMRHAGQSVQAGSPVDDPDEPLAYEAQGLRGL